MARPTSGKRGSALNLYVHPAIRAAITVHAAKHYALSVSKIAERLFRRELRSKRPLACGPDAEMPLEQELPRRVRTRAS